ncbi:MAG: hypothetical protein ACRD2E_06985 [Terriglobales bacterium]
MTDFYATFAGSRLGKVQSGKTRALIGVVGQALGSGLDVAFVFTEPRRSLSMQTERRCGLTAALGRGQSALGGALCRTRATRRPG